MPKRSVKVMSNNIHPKSEVAPPHSKQKKSGQELSPYPEVMKKKVKKKEAKGEYQFSNPGVLYQK